MLVSRNPAQPAYNISSWSLIWRSTVFRNAKIDGPLSRAWCAHVTKWTSVKEQMIGRQAPIEENIAAASLLGVASQYKMER